MDELILMAQAGDEEAFANMSEQEIMLLHRLLLQMKENLIKGEKD